MIAKNLLFGAATAAVLLSIQTGCASREYVDKRVELSEARLKEDIDEVETQVEQTQTEFDQRIRTLEETEPENDQMEIINQLPDADRICALQALERAVSAGDLSEGRIVDVISLSDSAVSFPSGKADLTEDGRLAIDGAFSRLASRGFRGLVLEVQGHTDATGDTVKNKDLGVRRAESVATHLRETHGFPADRIRVVSYGETAPISSNDTADGRAANRRVTLIALR